MKTRISTNDGQYGVVLPSSLWSAILQRAEELQDGSNSEAMISSCVETLSLLAKLMTVLGNSDHNYNVTQVD